MCILSYTHYISLYDSSFNYSRGVIPIIFLITLYTRYFMLTVLCSITLVL
nr:MAG TPA: hypothetical protein [Bacteriophage sp.]